MSEHAASSGAAGETQPRPRHAEFYSGYVWAALALALGVGFALGAHMAMVLGLGLPLGRGFASFVQTHGHVQLVGWTGLFVMGVSLYFVPRMAGVPLAQPQWPTLALWLVAGGLGLRSIGQALAPYLVGKPALVPALWLAAASGVLEAAGILLYVVLLLRVVAAAVHPAERPGLLQVRPYFALMLSGWVLYALLNAALLVAMAAARQVVVAPAWNRLAIEIFLGFVLLPVALGVSVRTFPLYLRLPAPTWPVRGTAYVYAVALLLQLLPALPGLPALPTVAALGLLLRGGVLLWFVWQLDVLTRRRPPWTVQRKLHPGPQRRPTRPGLPDYGEFGRFERLLYAAYVWLVLAAVGEMATGAAALLGRPSPVPESAVRHLYLLGFITLLILGMAVRMLPGFWHRRQVASPALVEASFWLGNGAVISRVLLYVLPAGWWPPLHDAARLAFAFSGLLGMAAVACLARNLWRTARGEAAASA